jgi:hypothetical protein
MGSTLFDTVQQAVNWMVSVGLTHETHDVRTVAISS